MAELVLQRLTRTPPPYRLADQRAFEWVVEDDSPLTAKDPTPRVTTVQRMFTRGDLSVLGSEPREMLLTIGRDAARAIQHILRVGAATGHESLDVSSLSLTIAWYQPVAPTRVRFVGHDYRVAPAVPTVTPVVNQRLDTYLVLQRAARA